MIAATSFPNKEFCPLSPSPIGHRELLGVGFRNGKSSNKTVDARSVARLIDTTTKRSNTIGWVYTDADGTLWVVLKPYVRKDLYRWFAMDRFNLHRPDHATEPVGRIPLNLPPNVEVASCYENEY
jgi:hypothetical protein